MTSLTTNPQADITTNSTEGGVASSGRRTVYEIITERVLAQLAAGVVPWRKPWSGGEENAPRNLASGKAYRGINVFLLSVAPFGSNYWLTYRQATERGGIVRKGEHGYPVIFWKWSERVEVDEDGTERTKRLPTVRYYTVFNADQVSGIEVPTAPAVSADFRPIERCAQVLDKMPQVPRISHNEGRAFYRPSTDSVSLPHPTLFASAAEYYSTLFHELGHCTGLDSRLGRPGIMENHFFGDADYSKEELVAEMTSAFLCGHCGIEATTLDNSAAYIGGWLKKLRDDSRLVITASAQAQKAADFVLGRTFEEAAE